jgi:hypothetical protein
MEAADPARPDFFPGAGNLPVDFPPGLMIGYFHLRTDKTGNLFICAAAVQRIVHNFQAVGDYCGGRVLRGVHEARLCGKLCRTAGYRQGTLPSFPASKSDETAKSRIRSIFVIPAQAGIQELQ